MGDLCYSCTMASQWVRHLYHPTRGWCKAMVQLACIMILLISLDRCMEMANQLLPTCRIALFGNIARTSLSAQKHSCAVSQCSSYSSAECSC